VAARHVPRECVYRPKEGFSIPIKHWLKTEFRGLVERYLDPTGCEPRECSSRPWSSAVVEHLANRANHSHLLWSLLVFEQWRDRWGVSA
jgi:asparagine synthase (glutamine-hydrolysing)